MYLSRKASRARLREAQNARDNRAEIVKALSQGQITRRDLFKWGIFTSTGLLLAKNGLSPFAKSAYAGSDIPTGTPPSPHATPLSQPMPTSPKHLGCSLVALCIVSRTSPYPSTGWVCASEQSWSSPCSSSPQRVAAVPTKTSRTR